MEIGTKYNWGEIPIEIAAKICDHIEFYDDYESFSKVCPSWRFAIKEFGCPYMNKKRTHPWLMLADPKDGLYKKYYSLTKRNFLKIDLPPFLISPPQATRYFSSSGWLISVTRNISKSEGRDNYFNITIFSPFSNNIIEAPLFHINGGYLGSEWKDHMLVPDFFGKFAISTSPNAKGIDDFVLALTYRREKRLACWRPGYDDTWVFLGPKCLLGDICFFRGELYATRFDSDSYEVIAFGDLKNKDRKNSRVVANLSDPTDIYRPSDYMEDAESNYYLVESKYDPASLLVIERVIFVESYDENKSNTASFNVFKLNVDNGIVEHVKSLGNKAIFVGFNSTFYVNVDDEDRGCKADCIYYTDELFMIKKEGERSDIGIYSLRESKTLPLYEGSSQFSVVNPPLWIEFPSA